MVLGPGTGRVGSDSAVTAGQDQGPLLIHTQSAAIIEDKPLPRANRTGHIQLELRVSGADAQIACFSQTHLFLIVAAEEITDPKRERSSITDYLTLLAIVGEDGRRLSFTGLQNCQRRVLFDWSDGLLLRCGQLRRIHSL